VTDGRSNKASKILGIIQTIVDEFAPKGQNILAQGNALGMERAIKHRMKTA